MSSASTQASSQVQKPSLAKLLKASRHHGVVSCGRCLLLAWALLAAGAAAFAAPTSLRCPVGGSSDQSSHTLHGIDPNALSFEDVGERRTLLCLAIEEAMKLDQDLSKVDLLLESRADPTRSSETGSFPLQLASKYSNVKLARKLLQVRAEVNQQDTKRVSPLHTAVHQDSAQMVQLLLMHNANVNAQDQIGQSPVFFAGSTMVIAALIDAKADLHHLNKKGQSALHLAAHNGRFEAVAYLTDNEFVDESIDMQDERGRSPLHLAAAQGHQRVVSRLMDVGANPRLKMHNGQTPMTLADKKDTDLALYIYTRMTGGKHATWSEMMQNPMLLTLAAVMGVACFVNRSVLMELFWELVILRMS